MKTLLLFLIFLVTPAIADPFIELGVGASIDSCIYQSWTRTNNVTNINCSRNPLGIVVLGYTFAGTGFTIQADHASSLVQRDYGLNTVSIRYRYTLGN